MPRRVKPVREAQRRRTRKAIVDAAMRLVAGGRTPTIADVAQEADVSRRTIYMYFPTFEQLLLDATAGVLSAGTVDPVVAAGSAARAPEASVEALSRAVSRHAGGMMHLGRELIRLTVSADAGAGGPRRGYRRIEWIETALQSARGTLTPAAFARLVSALSVLIGWEAEIVLRDVRGLTSKQAEEVLAWATRTLVEASLAGRARPHTRSRR
ncbi:MAG TPA: TetR/AcrR family transcriptional regulator [Vicinamibacterales bacterium]|nr:TetR/AcrR family transcriptional regulator [Vicinamibacterales bacterium]